MHKTAETQPVLDTNPYPLFLCNAHRLQQRQLTLQITCPMIRDILTTKIFFYDVLQEFDRYLERFRMQKARCIFLLIINGMALVMAFLGIKRDRTSSAIISNLAVLSFFVGFASNSSAIHSTVENAFAFVWMFAAFELAFLCVAFVLSRKIKFFLLSLSFSLRATNMLEESTWSTEEPVIVMLVSIYTFVASYLFLYLLPKIGWAIIYSTIGSLFFCYTIEALFRIDCGIRSQLLQSSSCREGQLEVGSLGILYLTTILSVLLQVACCRKKKVYKSM